jgi:hypothetical protein
VSLLKMTMTMMMMMMTMMFSPTIEAHVMMLLVTLQHTVSLVGQELWLML